MTDQETAILICGVDENTDSPQDLESLAAVMRTQGGYASVASAALDPTGSAIREQVDALAATGAKSVVCVPAALFASGAVKKDAPDLINAIGAERGDLELIYGSELGIDPRLLAIVRDRIEAAEEETPSEVAREDSLLMVVGVGSGDEDADSDLGKVGRLLWEGMGFGWAEVCFAQGGFPSIGESFAKAARLGYSRIVVMPYVLFGGDVIASITDQVSNADGADAEILIAGHLGPDPAIASSFADRVAEALRGDNNMNCQMCTYREQVIAGANKPGDHHHDHHHHHHGDAG